MIIYLGLRKELAKQAVAPVQVQSKNDQNLRRLPVKHTKMTMTTQTHRIQIMKMMMMMKIERNHSHLISNHLLLENQQIFHLAIVTLAKMGTIV